MARKFISPPSETSRQPILTRFFWRLPSAHATPSYGGRTRFEAAVTIRRPSSRGGGSSHGGGVESRRVCGGHGGHRYDWRGGP